MAAKIRVLFVDDRPDNFKSVKSSFEKAFRRLGCEAHMEYEADPDIGSDRVSRAEHDVVFVDLFFAPPDKPDIAVDQQTARGLEVIQDTRLASQRAVIVVLSSGDSDRPEILNESATQAGADIVRHRRYLRPENALSGGGIDRLVKDIYDKLCDRGIVEVGPKISGDDDPGVQSALYDIERSNMQLLLSDALKPMGPLPAEVTLSYVAPGASGAHVLRVTVPPGDVPGRSLLIKLSRDDVSLMREVENSKSMLGQYSNIIIKYAPAEAARPRNGWSAIMMEFADDAVQLRRWLTLGDSADHVDSVLRQLFLRKGLAEHYVPAGSPAEKPIEVLRMPAFRQVLVRAAIDELKPVLAHEDGANLSDLDEILRVVRAFVRAGHIGTVFAPDTPPGLGPVMAHGDLHGGNVLVCTGEFFRPVIIDFAAYHRHHWAKDPARLMTDIVLRSLDADVESFLWRRLGQWRELMRQASHLDGSVPATTDQNATVMAALRWMAAQRDQILPSLREPGYWWEWHVALAEQLLRGAYQPDVPAPKRCFALAAAYDQIIEAQGALERTTTPY